MTERERLLELLKEKQDYGVVVKESQMDDRFNHHKTIDNISIANYLIENGVIVLPCKVGSTVWVSPNNGKSFHTGKLYGMNENGSYLVFVDDKVRDFVDVPFENKAIYDWFFKIYTREDAEQALKEREEK